MLSDIAIAQAAKPLPITEVAASLGLTEQELEPYGRYKAKITGIPAEKKKARPGRLVLVTAVNPTPAGEGKTTTTVGLGQAMNKIGKNAVIALREPSLGPVFGLKGGAAGGGYAQVIPMEDINLHFTGDFHAITSANQLLCAAVDNHIHQGNALRIDCRRILIKRCVDMNDRALREIVVGLGGKMNGFPRSDGFQITVASEIMAILCLCEGLSDLKKRLGEMLIAYDLSGNPVFCKELRVHGAMTALLKDAVKPNLVQTLENTPAIMHGGPFANIAHGCNSLLATKLGLQLADYCITEAGFGSDLGAEKFFNIKCRFGGLQPAAVVLVATIRALKYNGGMTKEELERPDMAALKRGAVNLKAHIDTLQKYRIPILVALNRFGSDSEEEIAEVRRICENRNVRMELSDAFAKGGAGAMELAQAVCDACEQPSAFRCLYEADQGLKEKIETVAREIYGARDVSYAKEAKRELEELERLGYGGFPVCIAKTQYSLSDDPALLGRPSGFTLSVRSAQVSAGAGFVVILTGNMMTMPGLPGRPAAENIDISENGEITGLF